MIASSMLLLAVLAPVAPPAEAQSGPAIAFATPEDRAVVAGPAVEIAVAVRNFELVPAGSLNEAGKGHAHVLIDQEPPAPRAFLPTNDPAIIHMGAPPLESRTVELREGTHTLYAVLGDSEHLVVEHTPARMTIDVKPGIRAKGQLERACADIARGSGEVAMVFPVPGGSVQGTATSRCAFTTSEGACSWTDTSYRRIKGSYTAGQNVIVGVAGGFTTRQLLDGSRGDCGDDRTSPLGEQTVQAQLSSNVVRGTIGGSSFTLTVDPSVRLASPPATIAAGSSNEDGDDRSPLVYLPFVGAAVVIAGAVAYALRARNSPA